MIVDLLPVFDLVIRWYNFSNSLSQAVSSAQQTSDFISQIKSMTNYVDNTSQAERAYHDALKTHCDNFVTNLPIMGA